MTIIIPIFEALSSPTWCNGQAILPWKLTARTNPKIMEVWFRMIFLYQFREDYSLVFQSYRNWGVSGVWSVCFLGSKYIPPKTRCPRNRSRGDFPGPTTSRLSLSRLRISLRTSGKRWNPPTNRWRPRWSLNPRMCWQRIRFGEGRWIPRSIPSLPKSSSHTLWLLGVWTP